MSNYTKSTNFATKDSLASGNPLKVIKGTEIDDEFEALETAVATKADSASPTFTGTATIPTATITTGTITTGTVTTLTSTTANTTTINFGNWTVTEDGSNNLIFAYSGTDSMKLDSSGNITVIGDVIAYGTI